MAQAQVANFLLFLTFISSFLSFPTSSSSHNITHILSSFPSYSSLNSLLSKYGLAPQINTRNTITVLCPQNSILSPLLSSLGTTPDAQTTFNILSYLVLLDYYDPSKLKNIVNGSSLVATLYQTTGLASGNDGFLNITNVHGSAKFGLPVPHSHLTGTIGKPLALYPYNISLLDVNEVLLPVGVSAGAPSPAPAPINITRVIAQGGNFTTFISLIQATGVDQILQDHDMPPGVTIFAPTDAAFDKLPKGALAKLTSAQKVALLEYHAIPAFFPTEALQTLGSSQNTLASGSGGADYTVKVSKKGATPTLDTGFNIVPVGATLYSQNPVALFSVDSVLLPSEIFGLAPSVAPAPSPFSSPSSSPTPAPSLAPSPASASSPSPASSSSPSPSTLPSSPPAPPPGTTGNNPPASSPESANFAAPAFVGHLPVVLASLTAALFLM